MLERDVENWLVDEAKRRGGIAYKFTSPSRRSVPDRLRLLPIPEADRATVAKYVSFVEAKAPGKKATPAQAREHKRLCALGYVVYVMDSKVWPEAAPVSLYWRNYISQFIDGEPPMVSGHPIGNVCAGCEKCWVPNPAFKGYKTGGT